MEEKKKAVDMSDVWDVKHLKTSDFWFLHQDEGKHPIIFSNLYLTF